MILLLLIVKIKSIVKVKKGIFKMSNIPQTHIMTECNGRCEHFRTDFMLNGCCHGDAWGNDRRLGLPYIRSIYGNPKDYPKWCPTRKKLDTEQKDLDIIQNNIDAVRADVSTARKTNDFYRATIALPDDEYSPDE